MAEREIPEPPDGTRIEFTHDTDVYAAWRSDGASEAAGWTPGDGGDPREVVERSAGKDCTFERFTKVLVSNGWQPWTPEVPDAG